MRIVREDNNTREIRNIERGLPNRDSAVKRMIELARMEAVKLPNDPKINQYGFAGLSVSIGVNHIAIYSIVREYEYPHTMEQVKSNHWVEVHQTNFTEMLCCLPPAKRLGNAFAVGEELSHLNTGEAVYDCFIEVDGRYFSKPHPLSAFEPEIFEAEIRVQNNMPRK